MHRLKRCLLKVFPILLFFAVIHINGAKVYAEGEMTAEPSNTPQPSMAPAFSEQKITGLREKGHSDTWLEIEWDKLEGAYGYEIWVHDKATNGYNLLEEVKDNSFKLEDLKPGTAKSFLIRPVRINNDGIKEYGNFSDIFSNGTTPGNVTGFKATSSTDSMVVLEWDKVSDDAMYIIYRVSEGQTADGTDENGKPIWGTKVGVTDGTIFTDTGVSCATGYIYRIYAFCGNETVISEEYAEVKCAAAPKSVLIKSYKGGDGRARIKWQTVSAGDGYKIYMRYADAQGAFEEIARIQDLSVCEYVKDGLAAEVPVQFIVVPYKIYEGMEYPAISSNEVTVRPTGTVRTASKPAVYKTLAKLKKSAMYKKYNKFNSQVIYNKSIIMPGLKLTNVNGFASNDMVPQAPCVAGGYMLMSAYDSTKEERSVVYVIDINTRKYLTTLVLPDYYHVGGMAFDGINIWISSGTSISCFSYADVVLAVSSGQDSYSVSYTGKYPVAAQSSFITYYKNTLWIGTHKEKTTSKMYGYAVKNKGTIPQLSLKYTMKIPSRTQDVEFVSKTNVIISRANQVTTSKYYISRLEKHKLNWKKSSKGIVSTKKVVGKITTPPLMEGIAINKGYLYVAFESPCIPSSKYKVDRLCKLKKVSKLKWKK